MNRQEEAYIKFQKLKVGALFMQMGTGKTKVAVELVNYNIKNINLALFVCPNSVKSNLDFEIKKWGIMVDYIIISYENISMSDNGYLKLLKKLEDKKIFIVADESIFIKNDNTKRYKRLVKIRSKCDYALILNGTPIAKNEWDLYNQMEFLSPKILNMNREQFLNTFFKHVIYKKEGQKERDFYVFSDINAGYLNKLIQPYVFESKLDMDIKEKTYFKKIESSKDTSDIYANEKEEMLDTLANFDKDLFVKKLMKLCYISATDNNKNMKIKEFIKNRKVICFCNYIEEINQISEGIDCYIINGDVKTENRKNIIEEFKNNNKPLLITLGTGSYGLNLQFCNEIVFASLSFDFGKIEQAKYRIKRIGQEENIKYTYFLTELKVNDLMYDNLTKKSTLSKLVEEKFKAGAKWEKII